MKFTDDEKLELMCNLRGRLLEGSAEGYEIAITLIVLAAKGNISKTDVENILLDVYFGNKLGVTKALCKAETLIDSGILGGL